MQLNTLAVALAYSFVCSTALTVAAPSFQSELDKMATDGADFDPTLLVEGGTDGLKAVLDRLLPAKPPCPEFDEEQLVRLLQSDSRDDRAKGMRWVRQAVEAGDYEYLEIAHYAILSENDAATIQQRDEELKQIVKPIFDADQAISVHIPAFKKYVESVKKRELVAVLTDRVVSSLESNYIGLPAREQILKHSVVAIARSREKQQLHRLAAFYNVEDRTDSSTSTGSVCRGRTADWLIELAASGGNNGFGQTSDLDPLLVAGLSSNSEDVVSEAMTSVTGIHDASLLPETRESLFKIFDGKNDELKFQACFPLMYMFADAKAVEYLIEQATSDDKERRRNAIRWLSDSCNWGKTPSPELLEVLSKSSRSEDVEIRQATCGALGTYGGEETTCLLINILDDRDAEVAKRAGHELLSTPLARQDNVAFSEIIQNAATSHESERVRERCQAIIRKLDSKL